MHLARAGHARAGRRVHGDEYSYQAGAGVVADSQPAAEHDEVLAKSAALLRALKLAEAGL